MSLLLSSIQDDGAYAFGHNVVLINESRHVQCQQFAFTNNQLAVDDRHVHLRKAQIASNLNDDSVGLWNRIAVRGGTRDARFLEYAF